VFTPLTGWPCKFCPNTKGGAGGGSSCASIAASSCIFNPLYCVRQYGQCAIREAEAEMKCGVWEECDGVVCKSDYNGYCLARGVISTATDPDMWGYQKEPKR
jgi:hypothetical protein